MRKYRLISLLALIFSTLLISCKNREKTNSESSSTEIKGTINISGAFALYPLTVRWAEEYIKEYPKVIINVSAGGAGKGMADALSGMVELGMFSREVSKEEEQKGAWYVTVAHDAVLPTMNSSNPILKEIKRTGLTKENFAQIFTGAASEYWPVTNNEGTQLTMHIYTRSDACGAAQTWAYFLGFDQENLHGTGIYGDPGMADAVKKDPQGIGYNNMIYIYNLKTLTAYNGMEVIPIDLNGNGMIDKEEDFYSDLNTLRKAIEAGKYPSPPARNLYFISNGKPGNKIVLHFLNWVLTKGQKFTEEAGYIRLPEEKTLDMIEMLK